jgi:hypothetical protein
MVYVKTNIATVLPICTEIVLELDDVLLPMFFMEAERILLPFFILSTKVITKTLQSETPS